MKFAIATGLRRLREDERLKQGQLAHRLGVGQAIISQRENHTYDLPVRKLEEYAAAFGWDVPTLLERLAKAIREESEPPPKG